MNEASDPRLQRYLQELPPALPDAALGGRIQAAHLRRRAWRRRLPLLAAAALVAALSLRPALDDLRTRPASEPALDAIALAELRGIDRRIQLAYQDASRADERRALWEARLAAQARRPGDAPSPHFVQL